MVIGVRSMTDAIRLKNLLAKKGIRGDIVQTAGAKSRGGCAYALQVPPAALSEAENTARLAGITLLGVRKGDVG